MNSKFSAIIFDFDNTLVTSHIDFPRLKITMARKLKQYGFDFGDEKEIPFNYTAGKMIEEADKYDEQNGTQLGTELWKMVEDFEREGMENLTIDDDVYFILDFLKKQSIILSILTNNAKKPTLEVLERYNIEQYFDLVIAREDITKMKPDKEGLIVILEKLKLTPDKAIFVGDSWVDGAAAKEANIRFVLIRQELLDTTKYDIDIWKHIRSIRELQELL
ncbi:MAG: HAD-IA family hydrolase [Asgard group archaeon]|nr:HAD-IA family hydrolase [Asgard group archaeon]